MAAAETLTVPTQNHGLSMRPSSPGSSKKRWQSRMPFGSSRPRAAGNDDHLSREHTRTSRQSAGSRRNESWWKIRLFRGMINDVRRRAPYYWSDWKDAWDYRVVPATVYMYFAKYVPSSIMTVHQHTQHTNLNAVVTSDMILTPIPAALISLSVIFHSPCRQGWTAHNGN